MSERAASKDFDPIQGDYAFFMAHASEAAADVAGMAPRLAPLVAHGGPLRLLDLGCGDGLFSARLHAALRIPPERLHLTLVEPVAAYRDAARDRLAPLSTQPPLLLAELPERFAAPLDLVLANHCLYYVPDLDQTLDRLLANLAPGGLFIAAMAGRRNWLIQIWQAAFAHLARPLPYHIAEDLIAALRRRGLSCTCADVTYTLRFPDTAENRWRILRFLLADHLAALPPAALMPHFDAHSRDGHVDLQILHHHVVIPGA